MVRLQWTVAWFVAGLQHVFQVSDLARGPQTSSCMPWFPRCTGVLAAAIGWKLLHAFQENWNVLRSRMTRHCTALQSWKKPFNPLLGETWQAQQAGGGCQIFMEQLSHHPPISAFEMIGPGEPLSVQLIV